MYNVEGLEIWRCVQMVKYVSELWEPIEEKLMRKDEIDYQTELRLSVNNGGDG